MWFRWRDIFFLDNIGEKWLDVILIMEFLVFIFLMMVMVGVLGYGCGRYIIE